MTVSSISNVVTTGFIQRFQGLAKSEGGSSSSGGSAVTVADGLRLGARTFGSAVQSLNSVIGVVNLSQDKLGKLLKITDDMIAVASEAYQPGIGSEKRQRLNARFQDSAEEFRKIAKNGKVSGFEILTEEGLAALFKQIGLDKDKASSVAQAFKELNLIQDDGELASEAARAERPLDTPADAYVAPRAKSEYLLSKKTDLGVTNEFLVGGISSINQVVQSDRSGSNLVYTADNAGTVNPSAEANATVGILAVNESTGYYLTQSNADLTGDNPSNYRQLYLFDASGQVVRQVSNNNIANVFFISADLSQDNKTVTYSTQAGLFAATRTIDVVSVAAEEDFPPLVERSMSVSSDQAGTIRISNSGDYVAYTRPGGLTTGVEFFRVSDGAYNSSTSGTNISSTGAFGFVGDGVLALGETFVGVSTIGFADTGFTLIGSYTGSVSGFLEADTVSGGSAAFLLGELSGMGQPLVSRLMTISGSVATEQYTVSLPASSAVANISLAHNALRPDKVDIGFLANISEYSGDNDYEMYRYTYNPLSAPGRRIASTTVEPSELLDSTILSRPDAFRVLKDLTALREQIADNIDGLNDLKKLLGDNITLVRQTGLAFLDASDKISSTAKAEDVARQLQQQIKQRSGLAISAQAENLQSIVVAALALGSDNA